MFDVQFPLQSASLTRNTGPLIHHSEMTLTLFERLCVVIIDGSTEDLWSFSQQVALWYKSARVLLQ